MLTLKVTPTLTLKRATKTNPATALIVFADKEGKILGNLDSDHQNLASELIKKTDFTGSLGETISHIPDNAAINSLTVVGVGSLDKLAHNITKIASHAYKAIGNQKSATIFWGDVICHKHFGQFVTAFAGNHYRFNSYKKDPSTPNLNQVTFINNKDEPSEYETALRFSEAIIAAQTLTRNVANEPPNVCTPSHMAKEAKRLGKDYEDKLTISVLDEKKMQKLGMGCFLAVSQGSDEEGKIAIIEYFGKTKKTAKAKLKNPIALVGKGVTFDSGGISIKPSAGMDEMKYDMGGAAAMLGVAKGLCEANLAVDVVIVLACAENMPSGRSSRPGDIVRAMDGTTVEILNTDAEGRLVLADALCYVQDTYTPAAIIDAATLTGACVVALGSHRTGLYSNDEDTLFALENASEQSGDLVWHMPLGDNYASQIKSKIADLQNIGSGSGGGSITAACFLQHFIKNDTPWVHLDIAGTAWISGENKGASGRPVPLLMHYLKNQAQS